MSAAAVKEREDRPWEPYIATIRDFVAAGMPIPKACDAAGVRWSRAKHWLAKGKKLEEPYREFADAVLTAVAACDAACHLAIMGAAGKDWRAAAYMLDRRDSLKALEREQKLRRGEDGETTVVMYPVALPEGAAPDMPPHAFDTVGETVQDDDEEGEEHDDE